MIANNFVVLITNYNYGSYLEETIESVNNQAVQPYKVIIIDDGSTDNSREILASIKDDRFIIIDKINGGQLSCFNHAVKYIKCTDIVFLLDSDDIMPSNLIKNVSLRFIKNVDMVFYSVIKFNSLNDIASIPSLKTENDVTLYRSCYLTLLTKCWIGSPTSAIALTGKAFHRLFPFKYDEYWKIRADDVIVFGSSILGMIKTYAKSSYVFYRVHNNNNFHNKPELNNSDKVQRNYSLDILFNEMSRRAQVSRNNIINLACQEYELFPKNVINDLFIPKIRLYRFINYLIRLFRYINRI
jgi:glycosyltransferase involved in cell wall biosynthesis